MTASSRFPTASGTMARLAYAQAKKSRLDLRPLLHGAGLSRKELQDPKTRIDVRKQIHLLDSVANALADELFGFHLGQQSELRHAGALYYVLASSDTMADAFRRGARYSGITNEGVAQHCLQGRSCGFGMRYVGVSRHSDRHQIEFWMTAVLRICRQISGLPLAPSFVKLSHERRKGGPELSRYFGCKVEFGAAVDEIAFPQEVAKLPVKNADPYLNKVLVEHLEDALAHRRHRRGSFRASVENAIVPLLPHGNARAEQVARRMSMSQRTLARRLAGEGLTFSVVLNNLRLELADRHLNDGDFSISQVAWMVGYQDVSAFSNAFKRWTGKSPRAALTQ